MIRYLVPLCLTLVACGCPMASGPEPEPEPVEAGAHDAAPIIDAPSEGRCCTPECLGPYKLCGHPVDGAPE